MTNKEAIKILLKEVDGIPSDVWDENCDKFADAVQLAIQALIDIDALKKAYESDYQIQDVIEVCTEIWG